MINDDDDNDDDDNDECETRAAVWIEARNVKCRAEEVPPTS